MKHVTQSLGHHICKLKSQVDGWEMEAAEKISNEGWELNQQLRLELTSNNKKMNTKNDF